VRPTIPLGFHDTTEGPDKPAFMREKRIPSPSEIPRVHPLLIRECKKGAVVARPVLNKALNIHAEFEGAFALSR
jgi:hypothetical protein